MKRTIAMADNCIDVYYKQGTFYTTGNSIDFAFNYRDLGGDITEMTILGNDFFADALVEKLEQRGIALRVIKKSQLPTGAAKMALINGDRVHLQFEGNAMEEIELSKEDQDFVREFDIVYCERWCKVYRYFPYIKREGQIWVYDFSKRLTLETNDLVLPYIDYAFFSYDGDDEYIRNFLIETQAKSKGTVIAMLGELGSMAYDGKEFHRETAEKVKVVNTVGAGDSYIAGFTYGLSLGKSLDECMAMGKAQATKIIQIFGPYKEIE